MRVNEIFESAALFTPADEFGGIWIKPDGSHIDCDYEQEMHHPATFAREAGEEYSGSNDDYQHFMEQAQSAGWVRVAKHGRTFMVEFEHGAVSKEAIREITRLVRMATTAILWEFNILGWEKEFFGFNDLKDAIRFWNQYRSMPLREAVDVQIARDHESMLTASIEGKPVAWYTIDQRTPGEVSLHANVDAAARRQGISTTVYDWATAYFAKQGLRLVPSSRLSPEAHAMWQKRDPTSVDNHKRYGENYYLAIL